LSSNGVIIPVLLFGSYRFSSCSGAMRLRTSALCGSPNALL
jgi:hypothetical protein